MPNEDFYAGLGLAEAIRKLADHHAAPAARHISFYEYQLLDQAAARIAGDAPRFMAIDERAAMDWTRLLAAYWTGIASPRTDAGVDMWSLPLRSVTPATLGVLGLDVIQVRDGLEIRPPQDAVEASAVGLQNALGRLLVAMRVGAAEAGELAFLSGTQAWASMDAETRPGLSGHDYELVNRAIYQPSVPIESSPPEFRSVQDIIAAAGGGTMWLTQHPDVGPVAILYTGMAIIVIKVALALGDRLGEAIRTWRASDGRDA